MLDFKVSWLPVLVLGAVNFILSWLWYSPLLFAKPWMKALGVDPSKAMSEADRKRMPWLFVGGILSSFLMVYAMSVSIRSLGADSFLSGLGVGALFWAGFALTHSLNTLWEGRKVAVLIINNGLFLLTYLGFGGILAVWR